MDNLWNPGKTKADMEEAHATTYQIIRDFFDMAVGQAREHERKDPEHPTPEVFINMYVGAFCLGMELALQDDEDAMEIRMKLKADDHYTAHYSKTIHDCFGLGS